MLICRSCGCDLNESFLDLGTSPLANGILSEGQLDKSEIYYPLHAYICDNCFLVQLGLSIPPKDIFSNYVYFTSYSDTAITHAQNYTKKIISRFKLNKYTSVVEIASNDGYLLQYFKQKGIRVYGIEPAANVAKVALDKGIDTLIDFFDSTLALQLVEEGKNADFIIANNVLAHVPNLNDFVFGMKQLLNPDGVITVEFPHLLRLIENVQFDTIYHEHYSYLSLIAVKNIFERHGLRIFDVEELHTHGGSLRLYITHYDNNDLSDSNSVGKILEIERKSGLLELNTYKEFYKNVIKIKYDLLDFVIREKRKGKMIACYGAAAKGNTLLNYCGIGKDFISFVVDGNPNKQGLYTPGTHIPIFPPDKLLEEKPDYVLILPWNIKEEIIKKADFIYKWSGQFVIPIPRVEILS